MPHLKDGIRRMMEARKHADPARFFDVRYDDLIAQPAKVVRDIYGHFGFTQPPEMQQRIETMLAKPRKEERHVYNLEQFGLSNALVEREFAEYTETFLKKPTRS